MTWTPTTMGPSSVQLSARQILPTDLPTFNGNPDEWPTFISAFEISTSAAGFSNVENMLGLQKCLKGKAYDLVQDKLLLPTMVPEVISTLKTFKAPQAPDQILDRLIEKAKRISR